MTAKLTHRKILASSSEFKQFWKEKGPFAHALTSMDFPPVLLDPEEWIFSNDVQALLKELMRFDERKMKVVKAPFNPQKKNILRPEKLSVWKINRFPEEWDGMACDLFVPPGHLTLDLFDLAGKDPENQDEKQVEYIFFHCLESCLDQMGYLLLSPRGESKHAAVNAYLAEWEKDDQDAGIV